MLSDVRTAITDALNAADVGVFYPKERFSKNQGNLKAFYGVANSDEISGGYIRLKRRKRSNLYGPRTQTSYTFDVVFFASFVDESDSQSQFEDAIEALDEAFSNDPLLGELADDLDEGEQTGLILDDQTPVMFCGVLCHQARMRLTVNITR